MKKKSTLLWFVLVIFLCLSCINPQTMKEDSKKPETTTPSTVEKWQLIKMSGNMVHSERTGVDMAWQEYYLLNPDGTFIKSRDQIGKMSEASGTYRFVTLSKQRYLELNYANSHPLIGNCTGDLKEFLMIKSDNKMIGTWNICDGPGLEYEKVG